MHQSASNRTIWQLDKLQCPIKWVKLCMHAIASLAGKLQATCFNLGNDYTKQPHEYVNASITTVALAATQYLPDLWTMYR